MCFNPLFTTGLIVTLFIPLMYCLKQQKYVLNCRIPVGRDIGSSRYVNNYILSFWYPISILTPTSYAVESDPTHVCVIRHALETVSEIHGADGSALTWFFSFLSV